MESISVHDFPITLGQFLKYINLVGSGGEAKHLLGSYTVRVNNQPEHRRGRKLYAGDIIAIDTVGTYEVTDAPD